MRKISLTPEQFAALYNTDAECSTGFFVDEFDCDHADKIISFDLVEEDDGTISYTYSVEGQSGIGLGYTLRGISFDEIRNNFKKR